MNELVSEQEEERFGNRKKHDRTKLNVAIPWTGKLFIFSKMTP